MQNRRIIFLHVKKSAGTTFNSILSLQYLGKKSYWSTPSNPPKSFLKLSQAARDEVKLVRGHINFGCHDWFSDDSAYITILRDPKKRVFSYLNYWKQEAMAHSDKKGWWFQLIRNHSPEELLQQEMFYELENGMVRQLSGKERRDEKCNEYDLEVAIHNLEKEFTAFGLTERFDESAVVFREVLGWRMPIIYSSAKVRSQPLIKADEMLWEMISERNLLDEKLYQFAKDLFEEKYRYLGLSRKAEKVRRNNKILLPVVFVLKERIRKS